MMIKDKLLTKKILTSDLWILSANIILRISV